MQKEMVFLSWERDGIRTTVTFPLTESYTHKDLTVTPVCERIGRGRLINLHLVPETPLHLLQLVLKIPLEVTDQARMMVNGYQTWTMSREFGANECIPPVRRIIKPYLGPYGDYNIRRTPGKKGQFQSWTYTYFRMPGRPLMLLGSIDESFAYTVFQFDFTKKLMSIEKDLTNLQVIEAAVPLKIYIAGDTEEKVWADYKALIPQYRQPLKKCIGWTSWYNYYTNINERVLFQNLDALREAELPLDVFQIDDGYQNAVGDWLIPNEKFPLGMQPLAAEIKAKGYRPGLWLAPFICEHRSNLFKEHPEWILRNARGVPVKAGINPGWSGVFYALDFYAPGVRDYLAKVFYTVFNEWGYEMVKLDFLYAVALLPRQDRSRGRIMTEAMEFIREVVGDRWILGCGVPLGPSFGRVDYCRIGSDVAPYWEDDKLAFLRYRERVSTLNSLLSTIGRWHLNGRAFFNDPDVFILRDRVKLTAEQKYTLFYLNNLLGGLVFFSDYIGEYTDEQMNMLRSIFPTRKPEILSIVEAEKFCYKIIAAVDNYQYEIYTNLQEEPFTFQVKDPYFSPERGTIPAKSEVQLRAFETICLYKVTPSRKEPYLLGTTGHLFPGVPVKSFTVHGEDIEVELHEGVSPETKVYIGVPIQCTYVKINGKSYSAKLNNTGVRYIAVSKKELQKTLKKEL